MKQKLKSFIASFSTDELEQQNREILDFAKLYQEALREELRARRRSEFSSIREEGRSVSQDHQNQKQNAGSSQTASGDEFDANYVTHLQAVVSKLNQDEVREYIEKAQEQLSIYNLPENERRKAEYKLEALELRLFELTGIEPAGEGVILCEHCGKELVLGSSFCTGCGKEVIEAPHCPYCNAKMEVGSTLCTACGKFSH